MTDKGLKAFEDAFKNDEALRRRFEEALEDVAEAANDGEAMVKAAAQLGYEISLEELERAWADAQELDSAELEAVAGGGINTGEDEYGHDWWCFTAWHCYTATLHTKTNSMMVNCWSDYLCAKWWNED